VADLTVTAANVKQGTGAVLRYGTLGGAVTAGQPVYKKASDQLFYATDANLSAEAAAAAGIALNGGAAGQPLTYQTDGGIDLGATLVVGEVYVVSATTGGIAPAGDLASGWFTTVLGIATATNNLAMKVQSGGVARP
jgi:hypothetical protein